MPGFQLLLGFLPFPLVRWVDTKAGRRRDAAVGLLVSLVGAAIALSKVVLGPAASLAGFVLIAAGLARVAWAYSHPDVSGEVFPQLSNACGAGDHSNCPRPAAAGSTKCGCWCHFFTIHAKVLLKSASSHDLDHFLRDKGAAGSRGIWALRDASDNKMEVVATSVPEGTRFASIAGWPANLCLWVEVRGWILSEAVAFSAHTLMDLLSRFDGVVMGADTPAAANTMFVHDELLRGVNRHGLNYADVVSRRHAWPAPLARNDAG